MAIEFDGVDDLIDCGSAASLDNIAQKSIACSIDWDGAGEDDSEYITEKLAGFVFHLDHNAAKMYLRFVQLWSGDNGVWHTDVDSMTTGKHHIAVTYDRGATANDPKFYIDGVSVNVTETSTPTGVVDDDSADDWIVGNGVAATRSYDGKMGDYRVANVIWTVGQIAALAAGYRGALGGEVLWHGMCGADGISIWDGAVLVADTNYLPDLSINSNVGNPQGNPVGRAGQCPGGKSHSKRQFLGLV